MKNNVKTKIVSGVEFFADAPDFAIQLWLFRYGRILSENPLFRPEGSLDFENPRPYIGEGRFEHAQLIGKMLWPTEFEWHKYSVEGVQAFCENRECAITGGGGTSKSTGAAFYANLFFMCAPLISVVLIASTTIDAAKRRVWKEILRLYYAAHRKLDHNIYGSVPIGNPKPCIRMTTAEGQPDFAHGQYVVAVAKGELDKGINSLKGYHEPRMLFIIDEGDSVQQAVYDVRHNISIGCEEFQIVVLGNDPSLLNPLGGVMAEEKGKPITQAHKVWISAEGFKCLRFDGYESPNIPKKKFKGIISQDDIDQITKKGERANSPMAWIMIRGLHPPEGADETVLSEAALYRFHCFDKVTWRSSFITSASLDPGFGGDPCCFRTFRRGNDTSNVFRVAIDETIEIPIETDNFNNPAEYQIAQKVMELCKARSISPDEFVILATGTGRGAASVLMREWSPRIMVCEEGGACSDRIVSEENPRPAKELYDRKITELWLSIREFVEADMIRNLDQVTAVQLCNRKKEVKGTGAGKRESLEKKDEMKARGQQSPNEADAFAGYIDLLREKGVNASIKTAVKTEVNTKLEKHLKEMDFDGNENAYSDPLLDTAFQYDI